MAKKTRQELLIETQERVDKCKQWRESEGLDRTWKRLNDLYRGKHWPMESLNSSDMISVNLAFSTVNVIAPSVAVNYPKVVVQANKSEDKNRAVFVEAVVNHLWKHHDFRTPFRRAVKDFLIFGHGWVKVGWKFVEQEQTITDNERDGLAQQGMMDAALFAQERPDMAMELPTDQEIIANVPETVMKVIEDQPFVERISPFDVYVDPEATCLEDANWIAQRIVRPLEMAKKDKRYKPSARKRLSVSNVESDIYHYNDGLAQQGMMDAALFAQERPDMAMELPTDQEIIANVPETVMKVIEDQPFVERISPFDVYVDPEATCLEDANWIAQRIVRPLEMAKKDKRYKPSARKRLSVSNVESDIYHYNNDDKRQYVDERVVIWEYYDMKNNTICVYAEHSDEFLIDPIEMPYAYGQPFVMLRNYDVPDHFYPMGDLEALEPLQMELDKTRTQLMNDRKRYARKYLYHERSFGPEGREALESEDDGRLVPVVDENKPLSEIVMPMPQVPVSPEIYNYSNIIENDINTVSGISEYARGAMPEIRRTATEASIVADAQNARSADKLAIVEISISKVARRVIQLMQQFMTGEEMARVSMKGGNDAFIPYTREEIVGEYDFSVQAGSTQPMNETIRKQQAISLMNAIAPLVGTVIDPAALATHVLEFGFGIQDPEKFLMQQPPPEMMAQEEEMPPEQPPMNMGAPMPPDMGMGGVPPSPELFAPTGGVPPEILAQLQNQMGLELPSL